MGKSNFIIASFCISDVGRIRQNNEDNFLIDEEHKLYAVADGMGGHRSGEVASQIAIDGLKRFYGLPERTVEVQDLFDRELKNKRFRRRNLSFDEFFLIKAIEYANLEIYKKAQIEESCNDMGTTLVCLKMTDDGAIVGYVGDSRIYRLRHGNFDLVSEDHSLANEYIKLKILDPADVHRFPYKNVIVRALGLNSTVQVDTKKIDFLAEDFYLLCSDGLTDMVSDEEIKRTLTTYIPDLESTGRSLLKKANVYGGYDNSTILIIRVGNQMGKTKAFPLEMEIASEDTTPNWHASENPLLKLKNNQREEAKKEVKSENISDDNPQNENGELL